MKGPISHPQIAIRSWFLTNTLSSACTFRICRSVDPIISKLYFWWRHHSSILLVVRFGYLYSFKWIHQKQNQEKNSSQLMTWTVLVPYSLCTVHSGLRQYLVNFSPSTPPPLSCLHGKLHQRVRHLIHTFINFFFLNYISSPLYVHLISLSKIFHMWKLTIRIIKPFWRFQ